MGRQLRVKKRKPLIVICSEGSKKGTEYNYFRHFNSKDLRIQFSTGRNTDPQGMLNELKKYIKNEDLESEDDCTIYIVIDTDFDDKRVKEIRAIEKECHNFNVEIIPSVPTFELWFLMHYRSNKLNYQSSSAVKQAIKEYIPNYYENLDVYKLLEDNTDKAVECAKKLEKAIKKDDCSILSSNAYSGVYKIIEKIKEKKG